jgi:2-phosphosulfolactate phosphatase
MTVETLLSPLEWPALARRDLRDSACVVFDILRATSTFVTALHHGAAGIIPVGEIAEAIALRRDQPKLLLAGERDGMRIRAAQSGGMDFDFGNSPREFTPDKVCGQTIVSTTTNGTRALRACAGAGSVLAGSFLNLAATAEFLRRQNAKEILLLCAGTGDDVADEDVLAAGALIENLHRSIASLQSPMKVGGCLNLDAASKTAWQKFTAAPADLLAAMGRAKNGRRLLAIPELHGDVAFCAQQDIFNLVALMRLDGSLRRVEPAPEDKGARMFA